MKVDSVDLGSMDGFVTLNRDANNYVTSIDFTVAGQTHLVGSANTMILTYAIIDSTLTQTSATYKQEVSFYFDGYENLSMIVAGNKEFTSGDTNPVADINKAHFGSESLTDDYFQSMFSHTGDATYITFDSSGDTIDVLTVSVDDATPASTYPITIDQELKFYGRDVANYDLGTYDFS